jgi:hypothetical protein
MAVAERSPPVDVLKVGALEPRIASDPWASLRLTNQICSGRWRPTSPDAYAEHNR